MSRTCTASVLVIPVKLPLPGVKCALWSNTSTTTVATSAAKHTGLPQIPQQVVNKQKVNLHYIYTYYSQQACGWNSSLSSWEAHCCCVSHSS